MKGRLDVTVFDSVGDEWRSLDFGGFISVVFVAGIAHRKQSKESRELYFAVNRDLAVSVAEKAKLDGVGQFVYFSSLYAMGVKKGEISGTVSSIPQDSYSLSKYEAEKLLDSMREDDFRIAIIRPPLVYGPGCKGNFPQLVKIARSLPIIPTLRNKRSMIFIDNLTELMAIVIEEQSSGALCPQNMEYVNTVEMIREIARHFGKKPFRCPVLNVFIRAFSPLSGALQSAFGSLYYRDELSKMPFERDYRLVDFKESVMRSVIS